jgi:tRNA pseudouridine55 synthase
MDTQLNGWIILDKPTGITSAHAVAKVKRLLMLWMRQHGADKQKFKIGHAGTLDPLASGLLPLAIGEATKTVGYMMDAGKTYGFTVRWGEERDTHDTEGVITETSENRPFLADVQAILPQFTGPIQQIPPTYSAIKVDGQRSYDLARAGEAVELKAREVTVQSLSMAPSPLEGEGRGGGAAPPRFYSAFR